MAQIDNRYAQAGSARTGVVVDEGLRAYMLRVYNYMAGGIALTGWWPMSCSRRPSPPIRRWRRSAGGRRHTP